MTKNFFPVATGERWIGNSIRHTSSVIKELINDSKKSVIVTAYLITSDDIIDRIEKTLNRGVTVKVYIYNKQENRSHIYNIDRLHELASSYPNITVIDINDVVLHAKIIISDMKRMYCGSANLSQHALDSNYELGFLIEDTEVIGKIAQLLAKL